MRVARQVYYCGVSGMLGGLLAWLLIGLLDASRWPNIWLATAVQGGGVGALLARALSITRGTVEHWGFKRLLKSLRSCVFTGLIAGAIGLSVGHEQLGHELEQETDPDKMVIYLQHRGNTRRLNEGL